MTTIEFSAVRGSRVAETLDVPEDITVLDDGQAVPQGNNLFRILSPQKGDERLTWNSRSLAELQAAKQLFVDLIKKGLKPFRVGVDGKATADAMSEFDPHAEEVIFLPQALVAGG